jgi:tryptophan-rich sensory protein
MDKWYDNLKKSALTPPAYIFGPVWGVLYTLMMISLIIYLKSKYTIKGIALFGTQLAVNLIWPYLFFNQKRVCISLLNIFLMSILMACHKYKSIRKINRLKPKNILILKECMNSY